MTYLMWAGIQIDQAVARAVDLAADDAGVPRNVLRSIVLAEDPSNSPQGGDGGYSWGLLQLYTAGGQGDGYTPAQLLDVGLNLRIGVPFIRSAWFANAGLPPSQRVARTAAESGHPRDPLKMDRGALRDSVEASIARIVAFYEALEVEAPAPATVSLAGIVPVMDGAQVTSWVDGTIGWMRAHPREALVGGVAAALAFLL